MSAAQSLIALATAFSDRQPRYDYRAAMSKALIVRQAIRDAIGMGAARIGRLAGCGPLEAGMIEREFHAWIGDQDTERVRHWKTELDVWLDFCVHGKHRPRLVI